MVLTTRDLAAWGDDIELGQRVEAGVRNHLVRVVVDGRPAVARQGHRDGAALEWEVDLLDHLDVAGINVPRLLPASDGRRCVGNVVVMEEVQGDPLHPGRVGEIIDLLTKVHDAGGGWPQRPGFGSSLDLLTELVGGDVRLDAMPEEGVELCRRAWASLPEVAHTVVHGDPNPGNVLDTGTRLVLIDWDDSRVDHPWLDLAALGAEHAGLTDNDARIAYRASVAWETATCWNTEPNYARERLRELEGLST